jgi:hypothetical protein
MAPFQDLHHTVSFAVAVKVENGIHLRQKVGACDLGGACMRKDQTFFRAERQAREQYE